MVMMAEVKEQLAPSYSASVSIPISYADFDQYLPLEAFIHVTYTLVKEALQNSSIELFSFVHLRDLGLNDLLSESRD